jgi:hypothetical protein
MSSVSMGVGAGIVVGVLLTVIGSQLESTTITKRRVNNFTDKRDPKCLAALTLEFIKSIIQAIN